MKILILGSNGLIGSYIYNILNLNPNNIIFTVSQKNNNKFRKNHYCLDLNIDLKKLYKLILKEEFDQIINCLFIKNKKNKFDTNIPKDIINYLYKNRFQQIRWIEISSFSIFLKYKNSYNIEKKNFENFLIKKYRSNLNKLKILRIGNFVNEPFLSRILFFKFLNIIIIPSKRINKIYLTEIRFLKFFFLNKINSNKVTFNLITRTNIYELLKKNTNHKKYFFLNFNAYIFSWIRFFLKGKISDIFSNFLNLFFS